MKLREEMWTLENIPVSSGIEESWLICLFIQQIANDSGIVIGIGATLVNF